MNNKIFWQNLTTAVDKAESLVVSRSEFEQYMLCIIDINNGFARKGALYSPRVEKNIEATAVLAEQFLANGSTVLAYTDSHSKDSKEFKSYPPHCIKGTEESKLVDELDVLKAKGLKEIPKNSTNGILAHNPAEDNTVRDYIVIGCVTDICVYQYAMTLRAYLNEHDRTGEVYVLKSLVDTFEIPDIHPAETYHYFFLKSMLDNGIKLIDKLEIE